MQPPDICFCMEGIHKLSPIDFNGLDTAVHGPIRLGIMTALQIDGTHDFTALKKRLDVVDGSLSMHLSKLEEKKYITSKKTFVGKRPKTTYKITATGRKALGGYLNAMQQLLNAVEQSDKTK
jgi:DNA-binding PadR family transcriptional regulator